MSEQFLNGTPALYRLFSAQAYNVLMCPGSGAKNVMSVSVCLSVCLSVHTHISGITKFSELVTRGRSPVFLRRRFPVLRIMSLFPMMGLKGAA